MDGASHEEWPIPRLAQVSAVSSAHFARSFKEAFGVPPHRYLLTRRIERATALLRETDLPYHGRRVPDRLEESWLLWTHLPRHHWRQSVGISNTRAVGFASAGARARMHL